MDIDARLYAYFVSSFYFVIEILFYIKISYTDATSVKRRKGLRMWYKYYRH